MTLGEKKLVDQCMIIDFLIIILVVIYFPLLFSGPYMPRILIITNYFINLSAIIYGAVFICSLKIINRSKKFGYGLICVSAFSFICYIILLITNFIHSDIGLHITQILLLLNSIAFIVPRRRIENEKSLYRMIDIITSISIIIFIQFAPY